MNPDKCILGRGVWCGVCWLGKRSHLAGLKQLNDPWLALYIVGWRPKYFFVVYDSRLAFFINNSINQSFTLEILCFLRLGNRELYMKVYPWDKMIKEKFSWCKACNCYWENTVGCYKKINLINYADLKGLLNPRKKTGNPKRTFWIVKECFVNKED